MSVPVAIPAPVGRTNSSDPSTTHTTPPHVPGEPVGFAAGPTRNHSAGEVETHRARSRTGSRPRRQPPQHGRPVDSMSPWSGRVLVADPLPVLRTAVACVLARETDMAAAQAADLDSLLAVAAEFRPEVVLVDLDLPPLGGIEAVRRLTASQSTYVIVWSFEPRAIDVFNAIRANASGYLTKDIGPEALVRTLRGVRRGQAPLPRSLTLRMINELHISEQRERARQRTARLSRRESTVLSLVERSYSNRQIAAELFISEHTVKRHIQNILGKLQQSSRKDAAAVFRAAREAEALIASGGRSQ